MPRTGSSLELRPVSAAFELGADLFDLVVAAAEDDLADALLGAEVDTGEVLGEGGALLGDAREAHQELAAAAGLGLALERDEEVVERGLGGKRRAAGVEDFLDRQSLGV